MTLIRGLLAVAAFFVADSVHAQRLAVVIDDVGYSRSAGMRAVRLPGTLTLAVLPFSPQAGTVASAAHAGGHQVLVHLPMQSIHGHRLGPQGLTSRLSRAEFARRVHAALASVPFASGANNHMGSLLTTRAPQMDWLMEILSQRRGWLFLDSRTTHRTVAAFRARVAGVPTLSRDVFLDNERGSYAIRLRLLEAAAIALRRGSAVAIGHPRDSTLSVLEAELPRLQRSGITLVALAELSGPRDLPGFIYTSAPR
jgi:polysaccharide deacetylase 2 family uncharacterized protein YibQ